MQVKKICIQSKHRITYFTPTTDAGVPIIKTIHYNTLIPSNLHEKIVPVRKSFVKRLSLYYARANPDKRRKQIEIVTQDG